MEIIDGAFNYTPTECARAQAHHPKPNTRGKKEAVSPCMPPPSAQEARRSCPFSATAAGELHCGGTLGPSCRVAEQRCSRRGRIAERFARRDSPGEIRPERFARRDSLGGFARTIRPAMAIFYRENAVIHMLHKLHVIDKLHMIHKLHT